MDPDEHAYILNIKVTNKACLPSRGMVVNYATAVNYASPLGLAAVNYATLLSSSLAVVTAGRERNFSNSGCQNVSNASLPTEICTV